MHFEEWVVRLTRAGAYVDVVAVDGADVQRLGRVAGSLLRDARLCRAQGEHERRNSQRHRGEANRSRNDAGTSDRGHGTSLFRSLRDQRSPTPFRVRLPPRVRRPAIEADFPAEQYRATLAVAAETSKELTVSAGSETAHAAAL